MRTRHLISLVTGVLILSVIVPVGLILWLAHRQVESTFIDELNIYASRVNLRAEKVASQGKRALEQLEAFQGPPCSPEQLMEIDRKSVV